MSKFKDQCLMGSKVDLFIRYTTDVASGSMDMITSHGLRGENKVRECIPTYTVLDSRGHGHRRENVCTTNPNPNPRRGEANKKKKE